VVLLELPNSEEVDLGMALELPLLRRVDETAM
jgi:hypothetical protein